MTEKILKACLDFRNQRPSGTRGNAGKWYPDETERASCCESIRAPSRKWPLSLLSHCRTAKHICTKHGVTPLELKKGMKELEKVLLERKADEMICI